MYEPDKGEDVAEEPLTESMYYIMLALRRPMHGYGISQQTEELTKGRVRIGPGTMYGALQNLLGRGWIRVESEQTGSRRKKIYCLTDEGERALRQEVDRLQEALRNAEEAGLCSSLCSRSTKAVWRPG